MGIYPSHDLQIFGSDAQRPAIALGLETEQVQRAALAQIMHNLKLVTTTLQSLWEDRDQEYAGIVKRAFTKTVIPSVDPSNFYTGVRPSLVVDEPDMRQWPSITVYCRDSDPAPIQNDDFDVLNVPLYVEVLCAAGPVPKDELHLQRGRGAEDLVDRYVQRLTDAVHVCVRMDPSLGGMLMGPISAPPVVRQSLPWSRQERTDGTGDYYVFQGKQLRYTCQRNAY